MANAGHEEQPLPSMQIRINFSREEITCRVSNLQNAEVRELMAAGTESMLAILWTAFSAPPAAETTSESPAPSPAASTAASESDNESQGQGDNAGGEQAEQARNEDPENEASQPSSSGSSSVASRYEFEDPPSSPTLPPSPARSIVWLNSKGEEC